MSTTSLQYIGLALLTLVVVWGLYAAYVYIKISIAIQRDPYKRDLLGQLIDGDVSLDGPLPGRQVRAPRPMVRDDDGMPLRQMTSAEVKEQRKKHFDMQRRRERHHDAVLFLMGTATTPEHALALADELEHQNAARPLPDAPAGVESEGILG